MTIELIPIRATIKVNSLSVSTPYIQSFNIRLARGQLSSFDASLKVRGYELDSLAGGKVEFWAPSLIYTGIVKKATISPCWDDPGYVLLNISGTDVLSLLQGKKFSRRCTASSATWVSIDGVVREGLRTGKLDFDTGAIYVDPSSTTPKGEPTYNAPTPKANKLASSPGSQNILVSIVQVPKETTV